MFRHCQMDKYMRVRWDTGILTEIFLWLVSELPSLMALLLSPELTMILGAEKKRHI